LIVLVAATMAGLGYVILPSKAATANNDTGTLAGRPLDGHANAASSAVPLSPMVVATANMPKHGGAGQKNIPSHTTDSGSGAPLGGKSYAGSLVLDKSGSQLMSWNQTGTYCPELTGYVPNGSVATDSNGNATLTTNSVPGSCVALISPGYYSSNVIEADMYFPAVPGKPDTIANWTGMWLTDGARWPVAGELDASEIEPVNGENAVTWHSGTTSAEFSASTSGFAPIMLPTSTANLTPGWHIVDIVYTKGYFAVYYDGQLFTSYRSPNVTGSPLNIYFTMVNTPAIAPVEKLIGGPPVNDADSTATYTVKYVRVWSC
jgi:hypothetical protein